MNRTILTIGVVAIMFLAGATANAKPSEEKIEKAEVATTLGLDNASCSLGAGTITLVNGVSQTGSLPNVVGASCEFVFTPSGTATGGKIDLTGLASDFDLYVKAGSAPTTSSYDCRPYSGGLTSESCTVTGSTLYVMVLRYSGSGSFTVTAVGVTPPPTCSLGTGTTALTAATSVSGTLANTVGANCQFSFVPSVSGDIAQVVLSGLASDFDLYVKVGSAPTTTSYDCRPFSGGTTSETCGVMNTGATVFAMVRRYSGSGAFTITATDVIVPTLENGVPLQGHTVSGVKQYFKLVVPAGATFAQITLLGDPSSNTCVAQCPNIVDPSLGADVDLYVKRNGLPTTSSYGCRPWSYGNVESCTFESNSFAAVGNLGTAVNSAGVVISPAQNLPFAGAGKYFVMINPYFAPVGADWVLVGHTA